MRVLLANIIVLILKICLVNQATHLTAHMLFGIQS